MHDMMKIIKKISNDIEVIRDILIFFKKQTEIEEAMRTQLPLHEEGACPKCNGTKVKADDDIRLCLNCEYRWGIKKKK